MRLNIKLYDTLGCTVVATTVLQSLRAAFPRATLLVYTTYPDLLEGLKKVNQVMDSRLDSPRKYDIDLSSYLETQKPQESKPFRHLSEHMFEIAERQLGKALHSKMNRNFRPVVNLTKQEIQRAKIIVKEKAGGKPLVWLQTKSRKAYKDWPTVNWNNLISSHRSFSFLDLSQEQYSRRISIAISQQAAAGITLDTFMLHGSQAVRAKNVLAIMVSSHPEVVCYSD